MVPVEHYTPKEGSQTPFQYRKRVALLQYLIKVIGTPSSTSYARRIEKEVYKEHLLQLLTRVEWYKKGINNSNKKVRSSNGGNLGSNPLH